MSLEILGIGTATPQHAITQQDAEEMVAEFSCLEGSRPPGARCDLPRDKNLQPRIGTAGEIERQRNSPEVFSSLQTQMLIKGQLPGQGSPATRSRQAGLRPRQPNAV